MSSISVVTPTGARPEAFDACVEMMRAQSRTKNVTWIIVDDGPEPMPTPTVSEWKIVHIRPEPLWKPGQNTQSRNMLVGLDAARRSRKYGVVIVEDDDAYAPWWVERCAQRLETHDLIGESYSVYIHRRNGRRRDCNNRKHASLCSTAVKGAAFDVLLNLCMERHEFLDVHLWRTPGLVKKLYEPDPRGVTGIKGWPGRPGIGVGHRI